MKTETDVTEEELDGVRFGRNRFLHKLSGVMFGAVVASVLKAAPAEAGSWGCGGEGAGSKPFCQYCDGRYCVQYCREPYSRTCQVGNGQCWNACRGGTIIRCCDWVDTRYTPDLWCVCQQSWGTRQCDMTF